MERIQLLVCMLQEAELDGWGQVSPLEPRWFHNKFQMPNMEMQSLVFALLDLTLAAWSDHSFHCPSLSFVSFGSVYPMPWYNVMI